MFRYLYVAMRDDKHSAEPSTERSLAAVSAIFRHSFVTGRPVWASTAPNSNREEP